MLDLKNWFNQNPEKTILGSLAALLVIAVIYRVEFRNKSSKTEKDKSEEIANAVKTTWINVYSVSESAYIIGCKQGFERSCKLLKAKEAKSCLDYAVSYCKDAAKDYRIKAISILSTGN